MVLISWLKQQSNYKAGTDFADVLINEKTMIEQPKKVEVIYSNTEPITDEKILNDWEQKGFDINLFINEFEIEKNEIVIIDYKNIVHKTVDNLL